MDDVIAAIEPELRRSVVAYLEKKRLPGAAVGIVRDGALAWSFGAGLADRSTGRVPDADTLFRIASITKTFTATAVLQLRDDGRLRLDDPYVRHVPEFAAATNPFGPIEDVTIRRLLTHTSGLQGEPPNRDPRDYTMYLPHDLVAAFDEVRVVIPPESQTKYCNLGFEMLGVLVERLSGRTYREVVAERITGPLGMASTVWDATPAAAPDLAARRAVGYDPREFDDTSRLANDPDSALYEADGGLWSTVSDLARWLVALTRGSDDDRAGVDGRILDGATVREMQRPWIAWSDEPWTLAQGLGWYTVRHDDIDWTGHAGAVEGFGSKAQISVSDGLGVIVLLNTMGDAGSLAHELGKLAMPAHRDAVAAARSVAAPPSVPESWRDLVGSYQWPPYGPGIRVEIRGADLVHFDEGEEEKPYRLAPTDDPLVFIVQGGRQAGEPARFVCDAEGRVDAVNLGGYPMIRLRLAWTPPSTTAGGDATA